MAYNGFRNALDALNVFHRNMGINGNGRMNSSYKARDIRKKIKATTNPDVKYHILATYIARICREKEHN